MVVPMMRNLFVSKPAITARPRSGFVQVDVDFWMAQWPRATVTDRFAAINETDGLVREELHRTERIGL